MWRKNLLFQKIFKFSKYVHKLLKYYKCLKYADKFGQPIWKCPKILKICRYFPKISNFSENFKIFKLFLNFENVPKIRKFSKTSSKTCANVLKILAKFLKMSPNNFENMTNKFCYFWKCEQNNLNIFKKFLKISPNI
jgi:hypothetical protein